MKLGSLLRARKTISAHANEAISVPLAYKMMKFMKASDNEDVFYITKVKDIISKFEDKKANDEGNSGEVHIQKDKIQECQREIKAVEDTDVEAPAIRFTLAELNELKLSVTEVYSLDEIINEEG